jgi:aldehyde:ferredoxin oxidoreductase
MATSYGWAGKILRVDLTAGTCTSYPTNAFPVTDYSTGNTVTLDLTQYIGGRGIGYAIMAFEVPPGTKGHDPQNRIILGVGPITGSGSPSSGRTSITSLHTVHKDELPDGGQMGGHWGPELKYAGYDAVVVQGAAASPTWLRIEDDKVTLEDASMLWGSGIYFSTNYIVNNMGPEAHVVCIGPAAESKVRLTALYCDRSHRGGGQASVFGAKNLKAIGVRGTGAVNIKADKATWKKLVDYYMSLMGCNNQGVVANTLQPWSELSPATGGSRWVAAPGVMWGAAVPPKDLGNCPDVEHPMVDAPTPVNKTGLRTQKGLIDFKQVGMQRTVRMDGCHACPIRCHIALDTPELLSYGVTRYNMNTCAGNGGVMSMYPNTALAKANPGTTPETNQMVLAYMGNNMEDDWGTWNDYTGTPNTFKWYATATVANPLYPGTAGEPATIPLLQYYLSDDDWAMLNASLWGSGLSPLQMLANGDPRWIQFFVPYVAQNKRYVNGDGTFSKPPNKYGVQAYGTLGYYYGIGCHRLAQGDPETGFPGWPEVQQAAQQQSSVLTFKMGHQKHHAIETLGALGGLISMIQRNRDPNNHTHQNFSGNGLPAKYKLAIAQELFTQGQSIFDAPDESAQGKYAWWDGTGTITRFNMARAAFVAASLVNMELHNAITQCNYTLPVWASPLKSRNTANPPAGGSYKQAAGSPNGYRGDPALEAATFQAITGVDLTKAKVYSPIVGGTPANPTPQMALETMALRLFTLYRCMTAIHMQKAAPDTQYDLQTDTASPTWSQYKPYVKIDDSYGMAPPAPTGQKGDGNNMRWSHDYAYPWCYSTKEGPGTPVVAGASGSNATYLDLAGVGDTEVAKSMVYQQLGWDLNSGLPTQTTLKALELDYMIAKMQEQGIVVPA